MNIIDIIDIIIGIGIGAVATMAINRWPYRWRLSYRRHRAIGSARLRRHILTRQARCQWATVNDGMIRWPDRRRHAILADGPDGPMAVWVVNPHDVWRSMYRRPRPPMRAHIKTNIHDIP